MPIPLGVLAVAGAGGAAPGYALIQSTILGSNASSITFSSIPATYRHLQIRGVARNSDAAFQRDSWMRLNGNSSAVYSKHQLQGVQSTVGASNPQTSQSQLTLLGITANSDTASTFTTFVIDILDYAQTTKSTTIKLFGGRTGGTSQEVIQLSGLWNNTAAVNEITFDFDSGDFLTNSRISLYGMG